MRATRGEKSRPSRQADLYGFAEQLVDTPSQLEVYDYAKWNLLGHADRELRFSGHRPRPKRLDRRGIVRTLSVPVFSGYSAQTQTVMAIHKDPWTHQNDPESWRVVEQKVTTGEFAQPKILSAHVDAARRLWLQLAPSGFDNWPPGRHPALFARPYDQIRIEGKLDDAYHLETAEYREGLQQPGIVYEDIEALESMIVAVQQIRRAATERALQEAYQRSEVVADMGLRALASIEQLPVAG